MSIEFSGGMADDERIVSSRQMKDDEAENSLRPKSMDEYIGQTKAKENLARQSKDNLLSYYPSTNLTFQQRHAALNHSIRKNNITTR